MSAHQPVLVAVQASDFDAMAALRIAALRESLERLGRFDPVRARGRLAAGFVPQYMHHIEVDSQRVGFVTLRPDDGSRPACLKMDHLYIRPGSQSQGIGAWALDWAKSRATCQQRDICLSALKVSDANRFYLRHGFVSTGESEFDIDYCWSAKQEIVA
jgi:GNAT superfamily N-acetyltransferase